MISTMVSFFLLVEIRENLTLTLLINHKILFQIFIMEKFHQRILEKKIEELKFNYKSKNEKEEEINGVFMQANDLLKYRNKIINAFKNGTFLSEH